MQVTVNGRIPLDIGARVKSGDILLTVKHKKDDAILSAVCPHDRATEFAGGWDRNGNFAIRTAGGTIVIAMQYPPDHESMVAVCPYDRTRHFVGEWSTEGDEQRYTLVTREGIAAEKANKELTAASPERAKYLAMSMADLKGECAEAGVTWVKSASKETMVEKLVAKLAEVGK